MTMICHPVLDITSLPLSWLYFDGVSYICLNYDFIVLELSRVCLNILCSYRKGKIKEDKVTRITHSGAHQLDWRALIYTPHLLLEVTSLCILFG